MSNGKQAFIDNNYDVSKVSLSQLYDGIDSFYKKDVFRVRNGKKLGFIAQEIGREINTIGSKANDADMQKHVVMMKEELEKIKEQLNNIL